MSQRIKVGREIVAMKKARDAYTVGTYSPGKALVV